MTMGLKVLNSAGAALLDTSTVVARLIAYIDVAAGVSGSSSDPRFSGAYVIAISKTNTSDRALFPHKASISGSTLTYTSVSSITASRLLIYKTL